jgi:hypothetical protein
LEMVSEEQEQERHKQEAQLILQESAACTAGEACTVDAEVGSQAKKRANSQAGVYASVYRQGQRAILTRALHLHRQRAPAGLQAQVQAAASNALATVTAAAGNNGKDLGPLAEGAKTPSGDTLLEAVVATPAEDPPAISLMMAIL